MVWKVNAEFQDIFEASGNPVITTQVFFSNTVQYVNKN